MDTKVKLLSIYIVLLGLFTGCKLFGEEELGGIDSVSIQGTVLDADTGEPIIGCRVQYDTLNDTITDIEGNFVFKSVLATKEEPYILKFYANGYDIERREALANNDSSIEFGDISLSTADSPTNLKTIFVDGFEYYVLPNDLSGKMTYFRALSSCENATYYGYSDWTLPNNHTLYQLFQQKEEIGGFSSYYWSIMNTQNKSKVQDFSDPNGGTKDIDPYKDYKDAYNCRCVMLKPIDYSLYIANEDSLPISGVLVSIFKSPKMEKKVFEGLSDADGNISFESNYDYFLVASKCGYNTITMSCKEISLNRLTLESIPPTIEVDLDNDGNFNNHIFENTNNIAYFDEKIQDDHFISFEYSKIGTIERRLILIRNGGGGVLNWSIKNMPSYGLTITPSEGSILPCESQMLVVEFRSPPRYLSASFPEVSNDSLVVDNSRIIMGTKYSYWKNWTYVSTYTGLEYQNITIVADETSYLLRVLYDVF